MLHAGSFLFTAFLATRYSLRMGGKGSGRKRTADRGHGTRNRYASGCRCRACKKAWREYIASRRQRLRTRRYYDESATATLTTALSSLSCAILNAAEARTAKTRRDIIEQLLRLHGGSVQFSEPDAKSA